LKAALTGATGFVGSHLREALLEHGYAVRCLVRSPPRAAAPHTSGSCSAVIGDLFERGALARLLEGSDVVFHVAGAVAARAEADYLAVNAEATALVGEQARAAGVARFVYVSSLAAAGPNAPGHPADEALEPRPLTAYGRSKLAGERVVRGCGLPFTIVRPPAVYGPRDRQFLRLFRLARLGIVPLLGDGLQELSLVHARDLAEALVAAAASESAAGGTYNAAHPEPTTQRELAREVGRAVGRRALAVRLPGALVRAALGAASGLASLGGRATLLNPDKAAELLAPAWTCRSEALERDAGWRARIPLAEGLRQTAEWYRGAGWL
jgi:nucleoside-diphosphate-sugar epimerase